MRAFSMLPAKIRFGELPDAWRSLGLLPEQEEDCVSFFVMIEMSGAVVMAEAKTNSG